MKQISMGIRVKGKGDGLFKSGGIVINLEGFDLMSLG
jgi:hypothetical protein